MKILIFSVDFPPIPGGISTHAYGITSELNRCGDEIVVLAQGAKNDSVFDARQKFKIIRVSNLIFVREIQFLFWFIYLVRKYRIEHVINVVWLPCAVISLLLSPILKYSYSIVAFGAEVFDANSSFKRWIKRNLKWLARLTFKNAKGCFVFSNFTKFFLEKSGIDPFNLTIIPGGVDLNKFNQALNVDAVKQRYDLGDKKIILTVARLDEHKGHELIINSLPELLKEIPEVVYLVVGDGAQKNKLKDLVASLKLENKVIFTGHVPHEQTPEYFAACDIFVMPSKEIKEGRHWFEGLGIAYLEANACCKPVIGGASAGVKDAIVDRQTGLLVNPESKESLIEAMRLLLNDKEYAERLGKNGRIRIERDFSWETIVQRMKAVIGKVKTKFKVLHVHTLPVISGSGINAIITMNGLNKDKYGVGFACRPAGPLIDEITKQGITFHPVRHLLQEVNIVSDLMALWELIRLLKQQKYDIVHTHNSKAGFTGRLAAKIAGVPIIVHTIHGFSFHDFEKPPRQKLFIFLERFAAGLADKLITVSEPLKTWGLRLGIGRPEQYTTIYDGIEIEKFKTDFDLQKKRMEFGIKPDELVVGSVSKLWEGKGLEEILKAARDVISVVPNVKFMFVGEGYLRGKLEKMTQDLGLSNHVIFTGFRTDIPQINAFFDLAVLASFFEGLGRVLLEAMVLGKPVVATSVGGIVDVVDDGKNGILVPPSDHAALAKAFITLLQDRELRVKMGEAARQKIDEKFSAQTMVSKIESLYDELIRKKGLDKRGINE